jgi:hypothetical protein
LLSQSNFIHQRGVGLSVKKDSAQQLEVVEQELAVEYPIELLSIPLGCSHYTTIAVVVNQSPSPLNNLLAKALPFVTYMSQLILAKEYRH